MMKIIVDKLPTNCKECLFCDKNDICKIDGITHENNCNYLLNKNVIIANYEKLHINNEEIKKLKKEINWYKKKIIDAEEFLNKYNDNAIKEVSDIMHNLYGTRCCGRGTEAKTMMGYYMYIKIYNYYVDGLEYNESLTVNEEKYFNFLLNKASNIETEYEAIKFFISNDMEGILHYIDNEYKMVKPIEIVLSKYNPEIKRKDIKYYKSEIKKLKNIIKKLEEENKTL